MRPHLLALRAAAAALTLPVAALAAGPTIAELAPPGTFAVVSVRDWSAAAEQLDATPLGRLWAEPAVREFVGLVLEEPLDEFWAEFEAADVRRDEFRPPTGHVGLAVAMAPEGEGDEPDLLLVADFGENAEPMRDLVRRLLELAEERRQIRTEEDEFAGLTITTITPVESDDDEEHDEAFGEEVDEPRRPMHAAWAENTLVVSTRRPALEGALDGLTGRPVEGVADLPEYREALAQHPEDLAAHAVLLTGPLFDRLAAEAAEADDVDVRQVLEVLGIAAVRSVSLGTRIGVADAMLEQTVAVAAPEKTGLLALFDEPMPAFAPPAFVGPDAASATSFSFEFAGVMGLARAYVDRLPPEQRQETEMVLANVEPIVGPALEVLGPAIHVMGSYTRPLAAESPANVWAIQVRDDLVVSNLLSYAAGQSGGLFTPRDFNGNVIYGSEEIPIAAGLGFGHLFIGQTAGVENAMRGAGNPDGPRLATEPAFTEGTRALAGGGVLYGFTDTRQNLEWLYWTIEHEREIFEKQIGEFLDEQTKAEWMRDYDENRPKWHDRLPPLDVVLRHLGDAVSEVRATDDGYRGRILWLRPRAE